MVGGSQKLHHMKSRFIGIIGLALVPFAASFAAAATNIVPVTTVVPSVSRSLAEESGAVELLIEVNRYGYVTSAKVKSSTNPDLDASCLAAIRQWRYGQLAESGFANGGTFVQPFHFGGSTFDAEVAITARPKAIERVAPVVPEAFENVSGRVTVAVQLDAKGGVVSAEIANSTLEELNAPCVAAIAAWKFAPAYLNGEARPSRVYVPFVFSGRELKPTVAEKARVVDNAELKIVRQVSPRLSPELASLNGEAVIEFVVDVNGYVANATVQSATDPRLGDVSRAAVESWKFSPVIRDGVAVASRARQPFKYGEGRVSLTPEEKMASVRSTVSPEFPAELSGASGFASVKLQVDENGVVTEASVIQSSHDVLKASVLTAARQWKFKPAIRGGQPAKCTVIVPFVFGSN